MEDTWLDVIHKAMRGLSLTEKTLASHASIPLQKIRELLSGKLDEELLFHLAPTLNLHPRALFHLAQEIAPPPLQFPLELCRFTTSFQEMLVHSYLLWSQENKKTIAFDTGANPTLLLEKLEEHHLSLEALFLTHAHTDHILGLKTIVEKTGTTAWIDPGELIPGTKALPSGFSYQLDSRLRMEAFSTPGHSPGGRTYFIQGSSTPIAIVGDALFAHSIGGIASVNYAQGLQDIREKILSLPQATLLCPGHGPITTVAEERNHNPFFATESLT